METNSLTFLGLGFAIGLSHSLDADHLVAISSIVSKEKNIKRAAFAGIGWGLGHTSTLFLAGLLILLLKITIPQKIALLFELIVGVMIIGLGISVMVDVLRNKKHIHFHTHDGINHLHLHSHKDSNKHEHYHKAIGIGMIHGLAGSAGLMLLVLSTAESMAIGALYILIFGLGSMIGMALSSSLISLPFVFTSGKFSLWNNRLRYTAGIFSVGFGAFLVIKILLEGFL